MSEGNETILRNALDAVDRGRRLALVGMVALFVAMALMLAGMMAVAAHAPGSSSSEALMLRTLYVSAAAQMLFAGCCTALLMFQLSRLTKSILRAIELGNKR
jgi:hypothetical protein